MSSPTNEYPAMDDYQGSYLAGYSNAHMRFSGSTSSQTSLPRSTVSFDVEDSTAEMSTKKKQEMKILDIFQKIDNLGNYSDAKWFMSLDKGRMIRFISELYDIWSYRSQINNETKIQICPPNGRPFYNMNLNTANQYTFEQLKQKSVEIMDNLVSRGTNKDSKCLGAYYVLGALTIVNADAAEALPWLYQSFGHYQ